MSTKDKSESDEGVEKGGRKTVAASFEPYFYFVLAVK